MKTKETAANYSKQYYQATAEHQKETSRQWRLSNPEKVREQDAKKRASNGPYSSWSEERKNTHRAAVKRWRAENQEAYKVAQEKANANRRAKYRNNDKYREKAKATSRLVMPESQKKRRLKLKEQVFNHYGKLCVCCGETRMLFLTVDHVNNDGAAHRNALMNGRGRTGGASARLFLDIIRKGFPDSFRILCYNCNCGRARNKGICAHEEERQANAAMLQSTQASISDCIN